MTLSYRSRSPDDVTRSPMVRRPPDDVINAPPLRTHAVHSLHHRARCGLRGCKNGPAPFPGRMSYKATKPGLAFVLYLSMFIIVLVFIRAPFYVLLVFIVCVVCLSVVLC